MRMPFATHWASMKLGLPSVTVLVRRSSGRFRLHKVPAQHQRAFSARIVARTAPDFTEPGACIKPQRRCVVFIDLEEHSPQAQARETPQMQVEQASRKTASLPVTRDRDGE